MKLPISVIVLTNRADERLRKCLSSVQWASEVLVIDDATGTDWSGWEAKFGCRVRKQDQPLTNFAQARNQAIQKATQPWVFFIDSDEVVTPASVSEIERVIHTEVDGVEVARS